MHRITTRTQILKKITGRSRIGVSKFSLLAGALVFALSANAADFYEIVDLGSLGGTSVEAFGINNNNDVVGNTNGDIFASHAFVYKDSQSSMFDLGFLDYEILVLDENGDPVVPTEYTEQGRSFAFAINNNDIAVGYSIETKQVSVDSDGNPVSGNLNTAAYFDATSLTATAIPAFVPELPLESRALSINDNNLVVGFGLFNPTDDVDSDGNLLDISLSRGFFYDISTGDLTRVEPLASDNAQNMALRDVNDDGFAVGLSTETIDNISTSQVVVVDVNDPTNLEKIEIFGGVTNQSWSVNSSKKIVGKAQIKDSTDTQAYIYDYPNQSVTSIGYLNSNFPYSEAFDINESDQVVGVSQTLSAPNVYHAFLYENDTLKDFNNLISCDSGWRLDEARSINDSGVVTGTGVFNGEKHAFMLRPIAGTAPNCNAGDEDSGSGSLPLASLLLLTLARLFRSREAKK